MNISGGLALLGVQCEGNDSRFGQYPYGLVWYLFSPFCPLNVLFFKVFGQAKTTTPLQASDNTHMKLGQRINVWWEAVY